MNSSFLARLWPAVACLIVCILVSDAYFDCRRRGLECLNGNCETFTGSCSCAENAQGNDCGLVIASISSDCPQTCLNDGQCINDDVGGYGCYCNDTFTGPTCKQRRAEVECNGENMTVTITPFPGFQGKVYISGHASDTACQLTRRDDDGFGVYEKVFKLREGCGSFQKNNTPKEGDITYGRDVIVQYNPAIVNRLDQLVTVTCEHLATNTTQLDTGMPSVDVHERTNMTLDKVDTTYEPVQFEIQERSGSKVAPPIYIGRELRLYIYLRDTAVYKTVKAEDCIAVNGHEGSDKMEQKLLETSCPTTDSLDVIRGDIELSDDRSAVIVNFDAFKFSDSNDVEFQCKVRMCKDGDDRCNPVNCAGGQSGYGRRRRDAEKDPGSKRTIVKKRITVLDPRTERIITGAATKPEDCLQKLEIMSTLIVMGIAILVLFVICFFMALRIIRSNRKLSGSETASTVSSDVSTLQIPRIRSIF